MDMWKSPGTAQTGGGQRSPGCRSPRSEVTKLHVAVGEEGGSLCEEQTTYVLSFPWTRKSSENSHQTAKEMDADADEDVGEEEPLHTTGVGVSGYCHVRLLEMRI